jgi:DAK2 domain fusion protein YloV
VTDREKLLALLRGAVAALERSRQRIDDLNVYPVPDGDTGTNLLLTVRSVLEAIEKSDQAEPGGLARATSRAALMGARGNSGVILSQIVRGAAEALAAEDGPIDGRAAARALRAAADAAYRAVREPVEGTMLTAIRALAEAAEAERDRPVAELLERLVEHGEEAVARTPDQLDVLREAGVVDAGAAGLVELVRGLASTVGDHPLPELVPIAEPSAEAVHQEHSRYRYCTTFVIEGELDPEHIERELEPLGDSLLVVGDPTAVKAHVHTDEPGSALAVGTGMGTIANVEIADMHRQRDARERRLLAAVPDPVNATDVVAVVAGSGNRLLFESLGAAALVEGGQSMNPSAADLVAAIAGARAPEVVVLPNNDNVVMAAEQASGLAEKPVRVVPTTSIPAGLAALVAFDPGRPAEANAAEMAEAAARVSTGAVTRASRDLQLNGRAVATGEFLGLLEDEPFTGGTDFGEVTRAVLERLLAEPREVLTLLTGEEQPDLATLLAELETDNPELEVEVHEGGQPHYPLLISAE